MSPKIHKYSMLPRKCSQPPCRNIEVSTDIRAKSAGTTPYTRKNNSVTPFGNDSSNRNTRLFSTMNAIVTKGNVREGTTSFSGITRRL